MQNWKRNIFPLSYSFFLFPPSLSPLLKNCSKSYLQKTSVSQRIHVIWFLNSACPPLVGRKNFCHTTEVKSARCCLWSWNIELDEMTIKWQEVVFFCLTVSPLPGKKEFQKEETQRHEVYSCLFPCPRYCRPTAMELEPSVFPLPPYLSGLCWLSCQETKGLQSRCLWGVSTAALRGAPLGRPGEQMQA